ncbi:IQ-domain 9 [Citrus sinensis]|uniref:IQ-domain 9 n=1 Tax=Citrus sinensis TaxID=2711 RepID=A0ACB8NGT5_CITSI|nr:IQ-domain 9 [Citrus sinensis]
MGGDWFKTFVCQKKVKVGSSKQVKGSSASAKSKGFKWKKPLGKESSIFAIGSTLGMPVEDVAAIRIQTAFRAYKARKTFRRLKGTIRLQGVSQRHSVQKQATTTLSYLHTWSKLQAEIRARRLCMIDWSGGPETMEEILSRINQREKAAVKRERAMAYAFSHQWRANPNPLGKYELGKADWGWSWKERWIAARPWEIRVPSPSISQKKVQRTQAGKSGKDSNSPTPKSSVSVKPSISNGKGTSKARRLSFPDAEKPSSSEGNTKAKEESSKKEQLAS